MLSDHCYERPHVISDHTLCFSMFLVFKVHCNLRPLVQRNHRPRFVCNRSKIDLPISGDQIDCHAFMSSPLITDSRLIYIMPSVAQWSDSLLMLCLYVYTVIPDVIVGSKHETFTQCWFNVGPPYASLFQHWVNVSCLPGSGGRRIKFSFAPFLWISTSAWRGTWNRHAVAPSDNFF